MNLLTGVILIGMKHTGKSTLGRMIAGDAGCPFFDLDDVLTGQYGAPGIYVTAREIYRREGPESFAVLEARAALLFAGKMKESPAAGALGGGTPENTQAMENLGRPGIFVLLREDRDVLYNRIMERGLPAYLSPEDPYSDFCVLFERREKICLNFADEICSLEGRSAAGAYRDIVKPMLIRKGHAR